MFLEGKERVIVINRYGIKKIWQRPTVQTEEELPGSRETTLPQSWQVFNCLAGEYHGVSWPSGLAVVRVWVRNPVLTFVPLEQGT